MDPANSSTPKKGGSLLKKSRSGCRDCRLRRVKCDEIKPICSNCLRRYTTIQCCDWTTGAPRTRVRCSRKAILQVREDVVVRTSPETTKETHFHLAKVPPESVLDTGQRRTLELRLMYHYTAVVCHTMPDCVGAYQRAWQHIIPQLSFESEMVLNSLLALSALHLHAHSPNDHDMAIALRRYLDRALVDHREALLHNEELSEKLWLSAVLISHVLWLVSHQKQANETYELPLQVFKILEGTSSLYVREKELLRKLGYDWIGNGDMPQISLDDDLCIDARAQLHSIEKEFACLLDAFGVPAMTEDRRSIYTEAKDYVLHCYRAFYSGAIAKSLRRFIGFMPLNCRPEYRMMLERHDPLAMGLMARGMVLLGKLDHAWWLNGVGEYEVVERDVRGMRNLMPVKLRWVMNWPCWVLDGNITVKRT